VTREGKEVRGFAGRTLQIYPVAVRVRWEVGPPEERRPASDYVPGARSRLQLLGLLPSGRWAVVTARGRASQFLQAAFRAHAREVARTLRSADGRPYAPYAALMVVAATGTRRERSAVVTVFARAEGALERAPEAVGRAVRGRRAEVQAWAAAWAAAGNGEDHPPAAEGSAGSGEDRPAVMEEPVGSGKDRPVATAAAPTPAPTPAPAPARAEDPVALLAGLLRAAGEPARARLRNALGGEPPADPEGAAAAVLARFPGLQDDVPAAAAKGRAWADRIWALERAAPVRWRALREALRVGPAYGFDVREPEALAALAALVWLFRRGERPRLEGLIERLP